MIKYIVNRIIIFLRLIILKVFDLKPLKMNRMPKYILKAYVKKNPIIIDCGAHDGKDSIELLECLGGKVHAFEAIPDIYEKLKKNTGSINNIFCYPIALSNADGNIKFYVSSGESVGSSSVLPPKEHLIDHPNTKFEETIMVNATTLDTWALTNKIEKIDFLWLDMQGAEKMMLEASPIMLKTIDVIYTEVSVKESYSGVTLYNDFKRWMYEHDFRAEIESIPNGWDCGDVLFVRFKK
jgi:2-O-methyltransferase